MIDHDVIERYVDQLLEVNGIPKGTEEQLRLLLSHLYTAVSMFQLLDADSKERVSGLMKILNYNFGAKLVLKERKRNKDKENISPTPPTKEKETKEKDEKNKKNAERFFSAALDERKMAFLLDCERHIERYGNKPSTISSTTGVKKTAQMVRCYSRPRGHGIPPSACMRGRTASTLATRRKRNSDWPRRSRGEPRSPRPQTKPLQRSARRWKPSGK
jgi:hypothetical protein